MDNTNKSFSLELDNIREKQDGLVNVSSEHEERIKKIEADVKMLIKGRLDDEFNKLKEKVEMVEVKGLELESREETSERRLTNLEVKHEDNNENKICALEKKYKVLYLLIN